MNSKYLIKRRSVISLANHSQLSQSHRKDGHLHARLSFTRSWNVRLRESSLYLQFVAEIMILRTPVERYVQ